MILFYCNITYFVAKLQRDSREEIMSIYFLIGEDHKIKSEYFDETLPYWMMRVRTCKAINTYHKRKSKNIQASEKEH